MGRDIWKQEMSKLPHPFPELAERTYITNSYDEFDNITIYRLLGKESFFYSKITGNTCSNGWRNFYFFTGVGKSSRSDRNLLVQIQEANSHHPSFCEWRISEQ